MGKLERFIKVRPPSSQSCKPVYYHSNYRGRILYVFEREVDSYRLSVLGWCH